MKVSSPPITEYETELDGPTFLCLYGMRADHPFSVPEINKRTPFGVHELGQARTVDASRRFNSCSCSDGTI